jgi:hypothetical protein
MTADGATFLSPAHISALRSAIFISVIRGFCLWFCMGVKLGLLTLREEYRPRVFENRVLRRIFGPKRDEVTGENCIMRSFVICTLRQV